MVSLSGSDASALAYLAEYPAAEDREQVIEELTSEAAREIAEALRPDAEQGGNAAADAIRTWAEEKANR